MAESRVPKQIVDFQRQIVEFQKTAFDSTFNALSALQDQQRELMSRMLEGSPVPGELKQLMEEWGRALETGREQFRDAVDRSFETVESYLERIAGEAAPAAGGSAAKDSGKSQPHEPGGKE